MAIPFGARFREVSWTSALPHLGQQAKGGLPPRRKRSPQARHLWALKNGTRRWECLTSELKHLGQKTTPTPSPFAGWTKPDLIPGRSLTSSIYVAVDQCPESGDFRRFAGILDCVSRRGAEAQLGRVCTTLELGAVRGSSRRFWSSPSPSRFGPPCPAGGARWSGCRCR